MEQSLLEFYLEKTGKTPEEVTHLEYAALTIATEYFPIAVNQVKEEVENLNPNL